MFCFQVSSDCRVPLPCLWHIMLKLKRKDTVESCERFVMQVVRVVVCICLECMRYSREARAPVGGGVVRAREPQATASMPAYA